MRQISDSLAGLGRFSSIPKQQLFAEQTPLELLGNLSRHCGGASIFVKRDDCTALAFGGNKVRQLEFYLGEAVALEADTVLITGAVQSNFVRTAAAAANKLGMRCHIQLEERVAETTPQYRESGNVLLDKLLGATLHSYATGEDESGADQALEQIATDLKNSGRNPYVIHLALDHPPLGALGYIVAADELLRQIGASEIKLDQIFVGSGSGATHAGLLFGFRALGSNLPVTGVCVRRKADLQVHRIKDACERIATLLDVKNPVAVEDIELTGDFLAPGYGVPSNSILDAIILGARMEGLIIDPVYTGKALAATIHFASRSSPDQNLLFWHTDGTPAIFAYQNIIEKAIDRNAN